MRLNGIRKIWCIVLFAIVCPAVVRSQCTNFVVGTSHDNTTYAAPVNNNYNYSFTEILYTADEIDAQPGLIKTIGFEYAGSSTMTKKSNVTIYMANVTTSVFATTTSWVTTGLTQVYSGTLNCQAGWNNFQLNGTGFNWTGGGLLVVLDDNSGAYDGTSYTWYYTETAGSTVLRYNSDGTHYTLTGSNRISSQTGSLTTYRPNTQFCIDENCSRRDGAFAFSGDSFMYVPGSGSFVEPTLDTTSSASLHPYTGTVSYSSSDESIATVDPTTGEVSFTGAYGSVTITATATYGDYCPEKARYTVTVYDGLALSSLR